MKKGILFFFITLFISVLLVGGCTISGVKVDHATTDKTVNPLLSPTQ
jgi:hypothetical protein